MLLAVAVLWAFPQLSIATPHTADKAVSDAALSIAEAKDGADAKSALYARADVALSPNLDTTANATSPATASETAASVNTVEAALPEPPAAMAVKPAAHAPLAFLKPARPGIVSVQQLREENRRKQWEWRGLAFAASGAATFDAWTTRRAISQYGAQELNPMLRPFAGNNSLYAAIQVAPVLLDFAGKKMMYSKHAWMRRAWWVPQSASVVSSILCGAHNLAYH